MTRKRKASQKPKAKPMTARKASTSTKTPAAPKATYSSNPRIADLDEFTGAMRSSDLPHHARTVAHYEHPSGRCYVPVKVPAKHHAALHGELMNLSVDEVELLWDLSFNALHPLSPSIILFDAADATTEEWRAARFPARDPFFETIAEATIRQMKLLAVAMGESSDVLDGFAFEPWWTETPLNDIDPAETDAAEKAADRLLCRLMDKIELTRQELRIPRGPCSMRFADFLKRTPQEELDTPSAAPEGEWSKPTSKTRIATALGIDSPKTFEAYARRIGLRQAGNRQTYRVRMDGLTEQEKVRILKL